MSKKENKASKIVIRRPKITIRLKKSKEVENYDVEPSNLADQISGKSVRSKFRGDSTDPGDKLTTYDVNTEEKMIDYSNPWRFTPMYKPKVTGAELIWWIGFDPNSNEILMAHGQVNGKIQVNRTEVLLNKSNRNMKSQSIQDIRQKRLIKTREGYRAPGEEPPIIKDAMLAAKWKPDSTQLKYPVGLQRKLDGVRCLSRIGEDGKVSMRSRNGVEWPEERSKYFITDIEAFISFFPGRVEIDGEMYGHGMLFENVISIIKNSKKMEKQVDDIAYHIFTYTDPTLTAEERYDNLVKAYNIYINEGYNPKRIVIVDMENAKSKDEIFEKHKQYLSEGFEGTMIYKFGNGAKVDSTAWKQSLYKPKRSNNLLKYKATPDGEDMYEEEGTIIDFYEAKGTQKGAVMFKVVDSDGLEFKVGLKCTIEKRREIFEDGDSYIGKKITYMYQNKTKNGKPRFPIGKCIRDYE